MLLLLNWCCCCCCCCSIGVVAGAGAGAGAGVVAVVAVSVGCRGPQIVVSICEIAVGGCCFHHLVAIWSVANDWQNIRDAIPTFVKLLQPHHQQLQSLPHL